MEHEVFVPVTVQAVRDVLADPARVARCVPGLQQDADASAGPLSGRLKVRAGGHSITYRGALRLVAQQDGTYAVEGEGTEVRGSGSVKLVLTVRLAEAEGGTSLAFSGSVQADGRLTDLPPEAAAATAHRLLDRFAESLTSTAASGGPTDSAVDAEAGADGLDEGDSDESDIDDDGVDHGAVTEMRTGAETGLYDAPVPPPGLSPLDDEADDDFIAGVPPAEAAHARRTMIGRSAEEVDHAPPRGRYAPTPGPETASATATLRWLAPAAALALASAVVVGRALRRRK
ncbi:SRPBCC domain-containing protein [Streptomyces sp. NPDC013953]|uniref:SRPBCC domain-containing protein n=1 Tax=Streptomyces sp. NPDC013953 TaxID=3364868 RepID=UPI0036F8E7C9